ncbi:MAG TPA: gluconate 2-dehydrogenase subunit 3 family protein [Solirubrobacteraceae bacterium]|jgi:hypothetical protein
MAFDHSSQYQAADAAADVNRQLGQAYVEPGSEAGELQIVDPRRAAILEAWGRTLLPGDGAWPSGADVPFVGYVDRTLGLAAPLRPVVLQALDAVDEHASQTAGRGFADASDDERIAVLRWFEASKPLDFTLLKELAYEVYYRDPLVARAVFERTGFDTRLAVDGIEMESHNPALELLTEVGKRPSIVREVPS